jgi:hypothetical protein
MTERRREPQDTTSPERPTTVTRAPRSAFGRAYRRNPALLPERASVKCFIKWMREIGHGGEQHLTTIYIEFCEVVELLGGESMSLKRFRRALRNAGHAPYQADWRKEDGTRYRPQVVNLSEAKRELSVIASQMAEIRTLTPTAAKSAISDRMEFRAAA